MKGSDAIIETLISKGVDVTFGFPGGQIIPLFDSFLDYEDKINNILVRHEQGAAHAAEGYARALGKPGICITTSGPGATNLVTGIMDAYMDSTPIIAFSGQVPMSLIGYDAFQEADMLGITMPITKHNFRIKNANEAVPTVLKAFKICTQGRPGPVYVDLPKDCQVGTVTEVVPKEIEIPSLKSSYKGNPMQIKKAAEAILKAERPVMIVGGGAIISNACAEVSQMMESLMIPAGTTIMGKGAIPENHPLAMGQVGMHGRRVANWAVINSDLIIAIGVRFSDRITGNTSSYAENSKVIHIDIDPAEIGKNVKADIPIVGDAKLVVRELMATIKNMLKKDWKDNAWSDRVKELNKTCRCDLDIKGEKGAPIDPKKIIFELNNILKEEDIVATGVGQHQMFASHYLIRSRPRTFITSGGAGTMGYGLPASIGAKFAKPDNEVYCVDGDGSFLMNIQELATIKDNDVKINPVIFNNSYLGMVRQWLEIYFNKRYSQVLLGRNTDFIKMADAFGLKGIRIEKASEIADALKQQRKSDVTTILDVHIAPESNILPMLPPGGHLKDAFGHCMIEKGKFFNK